MTVVFDMEIVFTPGTTYMLFAHSMPRRILTDGNDWPKEIEPTFLGHSIGKWIDVDDDGKYDVLACGTPVLAYRAGAVEEVIDQGVTGMIVDNIDQARIASVQVAALDRRKVRRRFEERFTARRMASDYLRVYRKLVHAVARPRDVKYQTNGGARIGEEELIRNVIAHAD
jgi:hypothetical protein